jgi:catechol 2,3-dioxygenase-like lactoylglutathione lyase family enzyme
MIKGLHHNAYRCRDSEQTRQFYEGFLGLPLVRAFEITETKTDRKTRVLHSFYQMGDGSFLAFFEAPEYPFDFKDQHDYDLHIALDFGRGKKRCARGFGRLADREVKTQDCAHCRQIHLWVEEEREGKRPIHPFSILNCKTIVARPNNCSRYWP